MGEIWRILPLTCGETATFKAKFCERPLLSVMNVGAAAFAVFHLGTGSARSGPRAVGLHPYFRANQCVLSITLETSTCHKAITAGIAYNSRWSGAEP